MPATSAPEPATAVVAGRQSRPHIYEMDPLRIVTALVVVAVHVLAFVDLRSQTPLTVQLQNAALAATHFTRAVFMFVTAFTLTYVYYGKPFPLKRFWSRRSIGVLLPYCLWSAAYAWLNTPHTSPVQFSKVLAADLVTGNASYQLYYILLTLQFYLLLPLFLFFLRYAARWPWPVLAGSFALQWLMLYADYQYIQRGVVATSGLAATLAQYRGSCALYYPFYFVLGGLAAVYLPRVRPVLLRYGWWTLAGFVVALAAIWGNFMFQVRANQQPVDYAVSILQPIMLFYSVAVILFLCWLASLWARRADATGTPRGYRYWRPLSDASFGVYLIHAAILAVVLQRVAPVLPLVWPGALRAFVVWVLAAAGATALSVTFASLPILSRLVGRSRPLPRGLMARTWLAPWIARLPAAKP
ncbi:MAG TPA: acyltransferase family protein [Thermomicrobiales bacterium]|nr:acyltransferase family protein [Thermomicrobiales bacterium]